MPGTFFDPPPGGYGNDPTTPGNDAQWADNINLYWDETVPAPGILFDPMFQLAAQSNIGGLVYGDFPSISLFPVQPTFRAELISVENTPTGPVFVPFGGFDFTFSNANGTTCTLNKYRNVIAQCGSDPEVLTLTRYHRRNLRPIS